MLQFESETVQFSSEIKNRIKLSVAAYAYEYKDDSIMSDAEFDELSKEINPEEKTGNKKMDNFFKKNFNTDTGMWIRRHPDKRSLNHLYETYYKEKTNV